ncbi:amidohydrolase [Paenibacillus wenxiniae]|uniref:5-methylthioadenosine/S-adenosylhomocysteine deaminase n=1 Tax=Paenibacillus wenxiniae TaxID=1636843 RepID=A0ABW4RP49_9BACL
MTTTLWIQQAMMITMCGEQDVVKGDILIENDRIVGLYGQSHHERQQLQQQLERMGTIDRTIDATDMAVMPGMINAHQHSPMNLLKCFSDDLKLMDWLEQKMFPAEAKMTPEDIYWGSKLSMAEMIRSGTTTFADMYIHMNEIAHAVTETGMRASLTRGLVFGDERGQERMQEAVDLVERWQGGAEGRITTMFGPHAPYTCPPQQLREVMELAKYYRLPVHIHLAETREETAQIAERYGQTPTQYLYELGLFEHLHVLLAHGVHISENDMSYLQGMQGGSAHNPLSNLKLGCGIAPVLELQRRGITVGLGTDGAGSASTLDMFAGIRAASLMQKLHYGDPAVESAYRFLQMATLDSARLLQIDDEVGTLEVGKKADLILIDLNKPHIQPLHHLISAIAYAVHGGDVHTMIVNGQVLMDNRELLTLDEQQVMKEGRKRSKRLVEGI